MGLASPAPRRQRGEDTHWRPLLLVAARRVRGRGGRVIPANPCRSKPATPARGTIGRGA
jgi:hypothetical protein